MEDRNLKRICACPLNGRACVDGVRDDFADDPAASAVGLSKKLTCRWWERLAGKDPQSEQMIDQWDCAIAWFPILQVENAQMTRQNGASLDKLANQVVETKTRIGDLAKAISVAAENVRVAIEQGALHVMLPPPPGGPAPNGNARELRE